MRTIIFVVAITMLGADEKKENPDARYKLPLELLNVHETKPAHVRKVRKLVREYVSKKYPKFDELHWSRHYHWNEQVYVAILQARIPYRDKDGTLKAREAFCTHVYKGAKLLGEKNDSVFMPRWEFTKRLVKYAAEQEELNKISGKRIGVDNPEPKYRRWTDTTGKFSFLARLEKVVEEDGVKAVVLVNRKGEKRVVPIDKLSKEDRLYLRRE